VSVGLRRLFDYLFGCLFSFNFYITDQLNIVNYF